MVFQFSNPIKNNFLWKNEIFSQFQLFQIRYSPLKISRQKGGLPSQVHHRALQQQYRLAEGAERPVAFVAQPAAEYLRHNLVVVAGLYHRALAYGARLACHALALLFMERPELRPIDGARDAFVIGYIARGILAARTRTPAILAGVSFVHNKYSGHGIYLSPDFSLALSRAAFAACISCKRTAFAAAAFFLAALRYERYDFPGLIGSFRK